MEDDTDYAGEVEDGDDSAAFELDGSQDLSRAGSGRAAGRGGAGGAASDSASGFDLEDTQEMDPVEAGRAAAGGGVKGTAQLGRPAEAAVLAAARHARAGAAPASPGDRAGFRLERSLASEVSDSGDDEPSPPSPAARGSGGGGGGGGGGEATADRERDPLQWEPLPAGARVEALFGARHGGDEWYGGRLEGRNPDGTYRVAYDDGDEEAGVRPWHIRLESGRQPRLLPAGGGTGRRPSAGQSGGGGGGVGADSSSDRVVPGAGLGTARGPSVGSIVSDVSDDMEPSPARPAGAGSGSGRVPSPSRGNVRTLEELKEDDEEDDEDEDGRAGRQAAAAPAWGAQQGASGGADVGSRFERRAGVATPPMTVRTMSAGAYSQDFEDEDEDEDEDGADVVDEESAAASAGGLRPRSRSDEPRGAHHSSAGAPPRPPVRSYTPTHASHASAGAYSMDFEATTDEDGFASASEAAEAEAQPGTRRPPLAQWQRSSAAPRRDDPGAGSGQSSQGSGGGTGGAVPGGGVRITARPRPQQQQGRPAKPGTADAGTQTDTPAWAGMPGPAAAPPAWGGGWGPSWQQQPHPGAGPGALGGGYAFPPAFAPPAGAFGAPGTAGWGGPPAMPPPWSGMGYGAGGPSGVWPGGPFGMSPAGSAAYLRALAQAVAESRGSTGSDPAAGRGAAGPGLASTAVFRRQLEMLRGQVDAIRRSRVAAAAGFASQPAPAAAAPPVPPRQ